MMDPCRAKEAMANTERRRMGHALSDARAARCVTGRSRALGSGLPVSERSLLAEPLVD